MMYPFRSRVKEYVQSTDKLSLIGLTFHAGESYWGIHPYNYHIDDFTPLLPWNISKSSGIDWMEIELVNILFSLLQLSTWCQCSYILPKFWFPISLRTDWSLFSLTSVLRFLSLGECIMLHFESSCCVYCRQGFTCCQYRLFVFLICRNNAENKQFFSSFAAYCWQHCVVASLSSFHFKSNTMRNITKWIYINEIFINLGVDILAC